MGNFSIEVNAVGGHGCQRSIKDGETVGDCGQPYCPDCIARRFVEALKNAGHSVSWARLTHWPGETGEVRDDLLTGIRSGNF